MAVGKGRKSQETQRRLLEAAEKEFSAKGFDGARLGPIAKAAGVQVALIHHYFSDKEGLYRAMIERALRRATADFDEISTTLLVPTPDPRGMVPKVANRVVSTMMDFVADHASLTDVIRIEARTRSSLATKVIQRTLRPAWEALVAYIEYLQSSGVVRKEIDARQFCLSAFAMVTVSEFEPELVRGVWDIRPRTKAFRSERRKHVVQHLCDLLLIDRVDTTAIDLEG